MKLLYIVNARIPTEKAHGVQIMKMCEAFSEQGMDVTLAVPRRFGVKKADPFAHYLIKTKFKIVYLPIIDIYSWGYFGFILGSLSFAFSSFIFGLINKGKGIFFSRDQDQFSFFPFFFGLEPYFFEVHGLKNKTALHERLFKNISGVVATNSFIERKLVENFPNLEGKTALLPNGVELKMFETVPVSEAREKLSLPQDKKIVVYAGHLYKWKGVTTFVQAAGILPQNFEIYLVGGNEQDIDRLTKESPEAAKRVHFIGYRPYSEIPLWYGAADALIITGTAKDQDSVHYTSPIKLFEYMAARKPVVAIDSPAIRDIVSEKDVYFYKPDDSRDLARVLEEAITKKDEVRIEALQKKVHEYTWSKRAEKIKAFITRSLQK